MALTVTSYRTTVINFAAVPVTDGNGNEWRSIYFIPITNIVAGEKLQLRGDAQLGNDLAYNVEIGELLELRRAVAGGAEPIEYPPLLFAKQQPQDSPQPIINGENLSPTEHYRKLVWNDEWVADQNYAVLYAVARVRARSSSAVPGNTLSIKANQGKFIVTRIMP